MNTMLVVMLLVGRTWTPIHVVQFTNEAACQAEATRLSPSRWNASSMAVCVPLLKP